MLSSYQAALDFGKGYLNKVITAEGYDFVSKVKSEKLGLVKTVTEKRESVRRKRLFQMFLAYDAKKKKQKE